MQLDSSYSLNALKGTTSELDRATTRIEPFWNDQVSKSIDAEFINRIVGCCSSAIADIRAHVDRAEYLFDRLCSIGR